MVLFQVYYNIDKAGSVDLDTSPNLFCMFFSTYLYVAEEYMNNTYFGAVLSMCTSIIN